MSTKTNPPAVQVGDFILYQTEDGGTRIQCRFENETIWLSQVQLAELFQTSVPNINLHLKAIYAVGELSEAATIKSYLIVRAEGTRQVSRDAGKSVSPLCGGYPINWIPACAGMTAEVCT